MRVFSPDSAFIFNEEVADFLFCNVQAMFKPFKVLFYGSLPVLWDFLCIPHKKFGNF